MKINDQPDTETMSENWFIVYRDDPKEGGNGVKELATKAEVEEFLVSVERRRCPEDYDVIRGRRVPFHIEHRAVVEENGCE